MNARALFDAYNELIMLNGLDPLPEYFYRSTRPHFANLDRWCTEREIDPRAWILAKHEAIGWRFRLGPKKLATASDRFLSRFREFGDMRQAETLGQIEMAGTAVDSPAIGSILSERLKQAWTATPEVCEAAAETRYDPASRWCAGCRLCAVRS
jgi:hypothetical protein